MADRRRDAASAQVLGEEIMAELKQHPRPAASREALRSELLALVATAVDEALDAYPEGVGIVFNLFPVEQRRGTAAYRAWREQVLRDAEGCSRCGKDDRVLHAHHVKPWSTHPLGRFDPSNGVALCPDCHAEEHGSAGLSRMTP